MSSAPDIAAGQRRSEFVYSIEIICVPVAERATRIELACPAWEAGALPLSYARVRRPEDRPDQPVRESNPRAVDHRNAG